MKNNSKIKDSSIHQGYQQITFKIILIGQSSTGKTSLLNYYLNGKFDKNYNITVGVDFASRTIKVAEDGDIQYVQLQIWDTCGQDIYRSLTTSFYKGACAVFLIYSLNDRSTFQGIQNWLEKFYQKGSNEAIIFLIGNKMDLERTVTEQQIYQKLKIVNGVFYIETSARTGENILQLFTKAADIMTKKYQISDEFKQLTRPKNNLSVFLSKIQEDKENNQKPQIKKKICCN